MSGTSPVRRPRFFLEGSGNKILGLLVVVLLVALIKPWGLVGTATPEPSLALQASAAPSPPPSTADPEDLVSRVYDPLIFGDKELRPTWGLWPAGYLVSFGFAMRAEPSTPPKVGPAPSGPSAETATPVWPAAIDIPTGNHMLLIGINTPLGYSLDEVGLVRIEPDGSSTNVPVQRLPSPWPSHFTVLALDNGGASTRLDFWPPGDYRLGLTIDPGPIDRSIEIRVEAPSAGPAPTPNATGGVLRP
jgi:hypothetical protein